MNAPLPRTNGCFSLFPPSMTTPFIRTSKSTSTLSSSAAGRFTVINFARIEASLCSSSSTSFGSTSNADSFFFCSLFADCTDFRQASEIFTSGSTAVVTVNINASPSRMLSSFTSGLPIASICSCSSARLYACETACSAASCKTTSFPYRFSMMVRGTFPGRNPGIFTSFATCSAA